MSLKLAAVVFVVLIGYSCAVPAPLDHFNIEAEQAELEFLNSLSPLQRGLWGKIKDKVTSVAISTVIGAVLGKRNASDIEVEEFLNSLSPLQRGLWGKIKDKLTDVAISTAIGAVLGKRDASDIEVEEFLNSLSPLQRGLWGKIKDKVTNAAIGAGVNLAVGALLG